MADFDVTFQDENNFEASFNDVQTISGSYNDLTDRPQINGITLSGNKTADDLGLEAEDETILRQSDVVNETTSTSTIYPLSANMGKELQDSINNLKNIGRFLAIWDSSTGLPLSNPTTMPYTYKTGDYYRVGTIGETNYKPNGASYNGTASTTIETEDVEIGWVYYFDGNQWLVQSSGGGGLVQDVQINGTSILSSETGIANIPKATGTDLGVIKVHQNYGINIGPSGMINTVQAVSSELRDKTNQYKLVTPNNIDTAVMEGLGNNSQTWSDAYKQNARNTIGAITLQTYDASVNPVAGVLYYTLED